MCRLLRLGPLLGVAKTAILSAVIYQVWIQTHSSLNPFVARRAAAVAEADGDPTPPPPPAGGPTGSWAGRGGRWLAWTLIVLLFPLAIAPWLQRVLARKSNAANLAMLLGMTLAAGVAAVAVIDFRLHFALSLVLGIAAVGAAGTYNWMVLTRLDGLED